jgi:hypothetical protein
LHSGSFLKHIFEDVYKGIEIYRKLKTKSHLRNLNEILNKLNLKFKDFSDKFLELKNKENTDKEIIFDEAIDILHAAYNELFSIFSNRSINSIFYNKFFFLEAFLSESRREVLAMLHMDKKEMYGEIPSQETMDSIFYQRQTIEKYLEEWLKIV